MALPAFRNTRSSKKRRASHFALKKVTLMSCPKCSEKKLPHTACGSCGTYAGRQVVEVNDPLEKKKKG